MNGSDCLQWARVLGRRNGDGSSTVVSKINLNIFFVETHTHTHAYAALPKKYLFILWLMKTMI